MFDVLLESRAKRPRRTGGTIASALVHGTLIGAAVALAMTRPVNGAISPHEPPPIYVAPPEHVPDRGEHAPRQQPPSGELVAPNGPTIAIPDVVPPDLPPITDGPIVNDDDIHLGGPGTPIGTGVVTPGSNVPGAGGGVVDEHLVDRIPRLIGTSIEPRYPALLRSAGITGRVVAEFVVDTLGRVEMGDVQIPVASHALFAQAVRDVLPRYRFDAGEVRGRKVRTRVQVPFDFTLTR